MNVIEYLKSMFSNKTATNYTASDVTGWYGLDGTYAGSSANADYLKDTMIDRIAKDFSQVEFKHTKDGTPVFGSDFVYALNVQANRLQTSSDFLYHVIHDLFTKGDVFIFWDKQNKEFENLDLNKMQFLVDDNEDVYIRGISSNSSTLVYKYTDLIHLRQKPTGPFFSKENNDVNQLFDIVSKTNTQMLSEIANGEGIKGMLKITGNLDPVRKKKLVEEFKKSSTGGIGVLDNMSEFIELKNNYSISSEGSKQALDQLYKYFGVNENILNSTYTKEEYDAYVRSTLLPLATKLSQAFTGKLLGRYQAKEVAEGENVGKGKQVLKFELNTFKLAPLEKQTAFISSLISSGVVTANEARDLLDLSPVDGGDSLRLSLNYVDSSIANTYQLTNASDGTSANEIDGALKGGENNNEDNNI